MDKLTAKIKILNELYSSFKKGFTVLNKMFKDNSKIKQKINLTEAMMNQVYMTIREELETGEINKRFFNIIKEIKDEKQKKNR